MSYCVCSDVSDSALAFRMLGLLTVGYKLGSLVITPTFVQSIATSAYGLLFYVWQSSHDHGSTIVKLVTQLTEAQEQRLTELLFVALANDTTTRDMRVHQRRKVWGTQRLRRQTVDENGATDRSSRENHALNPSLTRGTQT